MLRLMSMRALRRGLLTTALLLVLAAAAGLAGLWIYIESNAFRQRLATQLTELLDRPVSLQRDVDVIPVWPLRIELRGLRIANPDWAGRQYFLKLDRLTLALVPGALLDLRLHWRLVGAANGHVVLAVGPRGQPSWPTPSGGGDKGTFPELAGAVVESVTLYLPGEQSAYVDRLALRAAGESRLIARLQGRWRDKPLQFKLGVPSAERILTTDAKLTLSIKQAQWGRSDLSGKLYLQRAREPTTVTGSLHSSTWILAPPKNNTEPAASEYLWPALPVPVAWQRLIALDIEWQIDKLRTGPITFKNLHTRWRIDGERLRIKPLRATVAGAQLDTRLEIRAGSQPPRLAYSGRFQNLELGVLVEALLGGRPISGKVSMRFDLYGRGTTTRDVITELNGDLRLVMEEGHIDTSLANLISLDLGRLLEMQSKVEGATPIRCLAVRASADDGVVHIQNLIIDTGRAVIVGHGTVHLATGALDITLDPFSREIELGKLRLPIHIGGTLRNPTSSLKAVAALTQAVTTVVGIVLSATGPLAELIGDGGNTGCHATFNDYAA